MPGRLFGCSQPSGHDKFPHVADSSLKIACLCVFPEARPIEIVHSRRDAACQGVGR